MSAYYCHRLYSRMYTEKSAKGITLDPDVMPLAEPCVLSMLTFSL